MAYARPVCCNPRCRDRCPDSAIRSSIRRCSRKQRCSCARSLEGADARDYDAWKTRKDKKLPPPQAGKADDPPEQAFFLAGTDATLPIYIWGQLRFAARLPGWPAAAAD